VFLVVGSCLFPETHAIAQSSTAGIAGRFPQKEWEEISPTAAGWDINRLRLAAEYAGKSGATSLMVIQHGLIVAKAGDLGERTELHSCRKSFLSALIGIAVSGKQIRLEDTLANLGIDDTSPSLTATEKQATVRDLLEARSGVYHGSAYETKGMAEKRPERGSHGPGSFWYYNNWDFNTLGAIYEHATGTSIFDALQREIATPIGMQDFRPKDGRYERERSSKFPAYPMRMSSRDLARFALLYLHNGQWEGR
jgi:CubicO group peptidase (beta-lactamase class C family)